MKFGLLTGPGRGPKIRINPTTCVYFCGVQRTTRELILSALHKPHKSSKNQHKSSENQPEEDDQHNTKSC